MKDDEGKGLPDEAACFIMDAMSAEDDAPESKAEPVRGLRIPPPAGVPKPAERLAKTASGLVKGVLLEPPEPKLPPTPANRSW